MAQLKDHQSSRVTKMLFVGDSGSGKTGALASLAQAGYSLRIVDLDAGLDVLANYLKAQNGPYGKDALARVEFETLTDPMKASGNKLVPKAATVWQRFAKLLDNWGPEATGKPETARLGPIKDWTDQDILVIDSLTMLSNAALNFVLSMNARLGQQPHQSDWYTGQQMIESLLQMLYDEGVKCNVILISHITYIGEENGPVHGYPAALGKALPPKIGRYFNTTLMAKTTGQGSGQKRKILTNTSGAVELKNTAPLLVKPEYDLATGLAEYFKAVRGEATSAPVSQPKVN